MIERLCIEEVRVDHEPLCSCPWIRCRTYHEASCNDNYTLGINSSCIYDWVPCDHGSDHNILLRFHFSSNEEHLSSTSQWSSSTSIIFHLRELTPLVSRRYCGIAPPLVNSSWCDTSHRFLPIHRFWVVVNQEHWIPFCSPSLSSMSSLFDGIV